MATTLVNNGHTVNVILAGTVASGDVDDIGDLIGVALSSGDSGDTVVYALSGVWNIPAADATYVQGEEVGVTTGAVVQLGTGSYCMEAKTTSSGVLAVMINGKPGA